jgi:hypothetical protein
MGNRGMAPRILNLGARWRWVSNLYPQWKGRCHWTEGRVSTGAGLNKMTMRLIYSLPRLESQPISPWSANLGWGIRSSCLIWCSKYMTDPKLLTSAPWGCGGEHHATAVVMSRGGVHVVLGCTEGNKSASAVGAHCNSHRASEQPSSGPSVTTWRRAGDLRLPETSLSLTTLIQSHHRWYADNSRQKMRLVLLALKALYGL